MSQTSPTPPTSSTITTTTPAPITKIVASPTLSDLVSVFFLGQPLVPPAYATWVAFAREIISFILIDAATYLLDAFLQGVPLISSVLWLIVALQTAYIILNLAWRILRAMHSPIAPLFEVGELFIEHILLGRGGKIPDLSQEPSIPGEPKPIILSSQQQPPPTGA